MSSARASTPTTAAAQARAAAARVLAAVVTGRRYLDAVLDETLGPATAPPANRALVQELAYGTLRRYHELEGIAARLLARPLKPKDSDIHALMLAGLYQLRYMRVAAHAAVDETVEAARVLGKPWAAALLNACLRAYLRRRPSLDEAVARDEVMRFSHPAWLIEAVRRAYPSQWEEILEANNTPAPLVLRVNARRIARADYLAELARAGLAARAHPVVESAVELASTMPVLRIPGFTEGLVSVQDAAAQLAAFRLAIPAEGAGLRVLDACAAPGGKTAHLLEHAPGIELVAVERDPRRLALIEENLARLDLGGLRVRLVAGDATDPASWWDGRPFDRILLDAPCSATGVIRRHPDVKLRRRPEELARLTESQDHLLAALWPLLRPGGKLLYVTCSILPEENEVRVAAFLSGRQDACEQRLPPPGVDRTHGRQCLPGEAGMDGFYYACLEKR
jgi:16S rRNA (cytosine967-C5)-methyltransferase